MALFFQETKPRVGSFLEKKRHLGSIFLIQVLPLKHYQLKISFFFCKNKRVSILLFCGPNEAGVGSFGPINKYLGLKKMWSVVRFRTLLSEMIYYLFEKMLPFGHHFTSLPFIVKSAIIRLFLTQ